MTRTGHPDPALPAARSDVVFRKVGEEWLLFDPGTGRIHVLNLTAALIWTSLDGACTADSLVEEVRRAYEESNPPPTDRLRGEVESAVRTFGEEGLLETDPRALERLPWPGRKRASD